MRLTRESPVVSISHIYPRDEAVVKRQPRARAAIRDTLQRLEAEPFDHALRTHKLKGDLANCWSCSAGYDLRIVFQFVQHGGAEAILLISIGTHDEVY